MGSTKAIRGRQTDHSLSLQSPTGLPFAPDVTIHSGSIAEWKEKAKFYAPVGDKPAGALWEGSIDKTAWCLMYNNWSSYNTSYEAGYYAAYYIDSNWPN